MVGGEILDAPLGPPGSRVPAGVGAHPLSGRAEEAQAHLEREIGDAIERVKEKATV